MHDIDRFCKFTVTEAKTRKEKMMVNLVNHIIRSKFSFIEKNCSDILNDPNKKFELFSLIKDASFAFIGMTMTILADMIEDEGMPALINEFESLFDMYITSIKNDYKTHNSH